MTKRAGRLAASIATPRFPGHSGPTDRATLAGYIEELARTQQIVREMNRQQRSREDIEAVLASEFNWGGLAMRVGLDGVINEIQ